MENPLVSIIVPVYNVEKYLDRAIDSIKKQTYQNYEVLMIDDGSTDKSLMKLKKYASEDQRVKVFEKENGGVGSARNLGLDNANGKYIYFMDPDDELLPNLLIDNVRLIDESNVDLIIFRVWRDKVIKNKDIGKVTLYSKKEFFLSYEKLVSSDYSLMGPWNKIYRSELIKNNSLLFEEYSYAEDAIFNIKYYNLCRTILTNNNRYYNYHSDRDESLSKKISSDRYNGYLYYSKILKKSFADCGIQTDYPYRDKVHFFYVLRKKVSAEHVHKFVNYLFPIETNDIKTKIKLFILWLNSKKIKI